jgi:hypothetical protein
MEISYHVKVGSHRYFVAKLPMNVSNNVEFTTIVGCAPRFHLDVAERLKAKLESRRVGKVEIVEAMFTDHGKDRTDPIFDDFDIFWQDSKSPDDSKHRPDTQLESDAEQGSDE